MSNKEHKKWVPVQKVGMLKWKDRKPYVYADDYAYYGEDWAREIGPYPYFDESKEDKDNYLNTKNSSYAEIPRSPDIDREWGVEYPDDWPVFDRKGCDDNPVNVFESEE